MFIFNINIFSIFSYKYFVRTTQINIYVNNYLLTNIYYIKM